MTKIAGKPYAGKPHVRFDEGAGKAQSFPALLYRLGGERTFSEGTQL